MVGPSAEIFAKPEEGFDPFDPNHVAPLVGFLASPAAAKISGNVFIVWGKEIAVMQAPERAAEFDVADAWSTEAVAEKVGGYFADKQPIKDSFIVPPV